MKKFVFLTLCALASVAAHAADSRWGGRGAELFIDNQSASVVFDCAHGSIPRFVFKNGVANASGTYTRGSGVHLPPDRIPVAKPAKYRAVIRDGLMSLTVTRKEILGDMLRDVTTTYKLKQGARAELRLCM